MQCRRCEVRSIQAATGVLWLTEQLESAIAIKGLLCARSYDQEARNKVMMSQCPKPPPTYDRRVQAF
jgi:hypothetical protein